MDMDYPIDLGEVRNIVDTSDVVVVRFATIGRRLLMDFRVSEGERPLIRVVRRARSAEERFRDLQKMRPNAVLPDQIITFHWPKEIAGLQRLGILDHIIAKFQAAGYPEMDSECRTVFEELRALERSELLAAVKGEGYQTLWERPQS